ncbi:glutathione S-transferase family protein [Vibrio breoganii]|uniref:glutathione S-transferase family protein n=1 Tax=Vibrio breoganii TaxID=553239 RepID=UPI0002D9694A|nr:glutathione S-transferase family protein [Vibrio breoganii]OED92352.1 glutathione S-transferase [Vibrio breoganii ZF-55]PMO58406.1 glutathione S-transferase [Vibrio breoganii]
MVVYGDLQSGNCLKVKLILSFLGIEHQWIHVNILENETKTPEFLSINPNGKIPAVALDDGRTLSESNAILGYFAEGTDFLPTDKYQKAKVYEWLFFEQYSHEPYIAVARFIQKYQGMPESRIDEFNSLQEGGNKALALMDSQLSQSNFLVGAQPTIADIALYAYTHVANEGGFNLSNYPHIQRWIANISAIDGYVDMS